MRIFLGFLACLIATTWVSAGEDDFDHYVRKIGKFPVPEPGDVLVRDGENETERKLTRQLESIVAFKPNEDVLWPGSLVQGSGVQDGLLAPIGVDRGERRPGELTVTGLAGLKLVSKAVEDPRHSTVEQAAADLLAFLPDGKQPARASLSYQRVYSLKQSFLKVGASYSWVGGSVSGSLEQSYDRKQNTILLRFVQNYYTLSFNAPSSPSSFFRTPEAARKARDNFITTEPKNPPLYVSSVNFGRELWLLISSSESYDKLEATVKASFGGLGSGGEFKLESGSKEILSRSSIHAFVLGGGFEPAVKLITGDVELGLREYLVAGASFSRQSPGSPISYQLRYLADNTLARLSGTADYVIPKSGFAKKVLIHYYTMDEDKDPGCPVTAEVYLGLNRIGQVVTGNPAEKWPDYSHSPHPDKPGYEVTFSQAVPDTELSKLGVQVHHSGSGPAWRMRFRVDVVMSNGETTLMTDYDQPMPFFNHRPKNDKDKCFDLRYEHLNTPIIYTGGKVTHP